MLHRFQTNKSAFGKWASAYGITKLSKDLGVHPRTIQFWLSRTTVPGAKSVEKITRLSKGKLTMSGILKGTSK